MAVLKPFEAVRPVTRYAEKVAALPYDVMGSEEARLIVKDAPYSFLHVDKAEVDLDPTIDPYDDKVYQKAKENLDKLVSEGILKQDTEKQFYLYRLVMDGRAQTGIVGCTSIDDYLNNIIKKHEFTRADKELDRIRHVDTLDANTGPIFLTYRPWKNLDDLINSWAGEHQPVYDFVSDDGITHTVWVIDCRDTIGKIEVAFSQIDYLYIADGHHRCASAVKVGQRRREATESYTGEEEFNYFLSVLFPSDQLKILDYNRLVKDLNGLTPEEFLDRLSADFILEKQPGSEPVKPNKKHTFGMYMDNQWYQLTARPHAFREDDPVGRLDVTILQEHVLRKLLGITDPRTDKRVDFVGGIRGLVELENRVNMGWKAAFSMFPTTLDDLMAIADTGLVMPPKSTWFEPKLRSGLFIHNLSD